MTVFQAFHHTVDSLSQSFCDNPQQEARWLLEALLGQSLGSSRSQQERRLTEDEMRLLRDWTNRRRYGEPLQYLLGTTEFRYITLKTDRRALIPRPETEGLVQLALDEIRRLRSPTILDVGTGGGAIALSLIFEHSGASAVGCDSSKEALELAKENGTRLDLNHRIEWILADLHSPEFPTTFPYPFDLIISNPPYVADAEYDELPPTVRDWEPKEALLAGGDGLPALRRLAQVGKAILKKGGMIFCEIGETQGKSAKKIFEEMEWDAAIKNDLSGKPRYLAARAA